jgi:rubrerythrin
MRSVEMHSSKPVVPSFRVRGITREAFLLRGAMAAGAAFGAAAVGPYVSAALAQEQPPETGDVGILNFALTLELLEGAFYAAALEDVPDLSSEVRSLAEEIASNEEQHVDALTEAIEKMDAQPADAPEFDWGKSFKSESSFLKNAVFLEDTGVGAYNGSAPMFIDRELTAVAASIVQVEGRHAGLVRVAHGQEPTVSALDEPLDQGQVLRLVARFIQTP